MYIFAATLLQNSEYLAFWPPATPGVPFARPEMPEMPVISERVFDSRLLTGVWDLEFLGSDFWF
jgi:hypothetical protein